MGLHFDHVRLNGFGSLLAGNGDAVIPIDHKVDFAHFIHFNGRQAGAILQKCHPDTGPAILVLCPPRQEGAGKVGIAAHTSHDRVERDVLYAALGADAQLQLLRHFLVG